MKEAESNKDEILVLAGATDKSKLIQSIVDAGFKITAVLVPVSKKYQAASKAMEDFCKKNSIRVIKCPPKELYEYTKDLDYSVLISTGYPFLIPANVFSRAKYPLNFHPTLLPKYRGRYLHPILINNDKETGVTCHMIDEGFDTGPIVKQIKYPVDTFDTIPSLFRKNIDAEVELALSVLEDISQGSITVTKQDESQASLFFEKRTPDDSRIDPNKSLKELFYEIRCCDPELYPAFFEIDGQRVYIKVYRKDKPENQFDMI